MSPEALTTRLHQVVAQPIPHPGSGRTAERHHRLFEIGREDLSLARLAEAHWDALAILAEAGRDAQPGILYGVWAAELPGAILRMDDMSVHGEKPFCSGAGIVDHALVTVKEPNAYLVDVDLRDHRNLMSFDTSAWKTSAFAETQTSVATFESVPVKDTNIVGEENFYLQRPGFWHGACGPAACWAGGAAGLVDWALTQKRNDAHTLAHLGAMRATVWSMRSCLDTAGREIDAAWQDVAAGRVRALMLRHVIEQGCTDILRRLARAYGPHPLAMDTAISKRYHELDLYVRQSHAERDLEALGHSLRSGD